MSDPGTERPEALLEAALAKHSGGRLSEAAELYSRFLAAEPGHADALHLRGMARFALGDLDAAVDDVSAAIEIQPDKADFHANHGVVQKTK